MANVTEAEKWRIHCEAHPIKPETIDHFSAIPATSRYLQDERYTCVPSYSRVLKPNGEDAFFAKTISTPETIPHYLTLLHRDVGPRKGPTGDLPSNDDWEPDSVTLITVGGGDLVGFPGVVHGGISTALLDEPMSFLLHLYSIRVAGDSAPNTALTANLNINFRGPVPGPGHVIVESKLMKVQGRKFFVKGRMKDTEGKVLVDAQGLWVSLKAVKL